MSSPCSCPYACTACAPVAIVLDRVPPPMLLLFKTNDCLRHAERQLGVGVNSLLVTLRHCIHKRIMPAKGAKRASIHNLCPMNPAFLAHFVATTLNV